MTTRDFIDYGFEPEFIGRLPVRVVCEELSAADLYEILHRSEGSIVRQYERAFQAYGIEASFTEGALRALAESASGERTGARGLVTVFERLLREGKYELPGSGVERLLVDEAFVADAAAGLVRLLAEGEGKREAHLAESAHRYAARFEKTHGVVLRFEDATARLLAERARTEDIPMQGLCDRLFKDYQFGLKLIQKNTGQREFTLPPAALGDPDRFISDWVLASYQGNPTAAPANA